MSDPLPTLIARAVDGRIPSHEIHSDLTFEDLDIDALDRLCIVCEIEEHFNVDVSDDEAAKWSTVADIEASIKEKRR